MGLRRKFALILLVVGLLFLVGGGRSLVWFRSWRSAEALVDDIETLSREIPRRTPYLIETVPGTFSQCALPLLGQASHFDATRDALERAGCDSEAKPACAGLLDEKASTWVQSLTQCARAAGPELMTFLESTPESLENLKQQVQTLSILAAGDIDRRVKEGKPAEGLVLCADTAAFAKDLVYREQLEGLPVARGLMLGVWWARTRAIDAAPSERKRRYARQSEIIRWGFPPRVRLLREAAVRLQLDVYGGLLSDGQKSVLPQRALVLANQRPPEQSPASLIQWQLAFPFWQKMMRSTLDVANELPAVRRVYLGEIEDIFRPYADSKTLPKGPDFEIALSQYDQLNALLQALDIAAMIDAEGWTKEVLLGLRTGVQKPIEAQPTGDDLMVTFKEAAFKPYSFTLHPDPPTVPAAQ